MAAASTASGLIFTKDEKEAAGFAMTGSVTPSQFKDVMGSGDKFASYVCLLPTYTPDNCPRDAITEAGLKFAHLPFEVPTNLTKAAAMEMHAALSALPGPIWIQCATANRASAVLLVHLALKNGWDVAKTFAYGKANAYKCMSAELLRNWIIAALNPTDAKAISGAQADNIIIRQLFDYATWTYTYIAACPVTREAVIIDPVLEKVDRDVNMCNELGLKAKYALNTHVHADHVSGTKMLKKKIEGLKSCVAACTKAECDVGINDGDVFTFGTRSVTCVSTPGHTDGCFSFILDDKSIVFSGDALFIRGCGRTDFQQGSPDKMYDSIHNKLYTLPESCVVYPGHDYNGNLRSTIGEEIRFNPRLNKTREEFAVIMNNLNLPRPRLIDIAVTANMKDGEPPVVPAPEAK